MRYLIVVAVIVLFVRIDFLLSLFDRATGNSPTPPPEITNSDISSSREVISIAEDKNLAQTPRENFLALLEVFRISPEISIREKALEVFRENPLIFNDKIDKELESHIFRWRELLNNNEPEVVNFLLELMKILKGENLEMTKRFFALWMDINMENFIMAYSRTRDTNCTIATTFGDPIPDHEKLNEYYERQELLQDYIKKEKLDPVHKALATNCLLVLNLQLDKLDPKPLVQSPSATLPEEGSGGVSP